jgi:hypothetical protein
MNEEGIEGSETGSIISSGSTTMAARPSVYSLLRRQTQQDNSISIIWVFTLREVIMLRTFLMWGNARQLLQGLEA